mmetsp:Transcript_9840/g.26172  ORF Transcript_9840/g.26172 Transcript_9840/m.26172 type:complete len:127 (-) Transcript_9840:294-674(-)
MQLPRVRVPHSIRCWLLSLCTQWRDPLSHTLKGSLRLCADTSVDMWCERMFVRTDDRELVLFGCTDAVDMTTWFAIVFEIVHDYQEHRMGRRTSLLEDSRAPSGRDCEPSLAFGESLNGVALGIAF